MSHYGCKGGVGGCWQHSRAHTPQLLSSCVLLPQNLQPHLATQEGPHPLKKRRKNQSSQPGHADNRAAKPTHTDISSLTESWQAASSQIKTFLAGLAPPDSNAVDVTDQHIQLQALLHTVLAARKLQSAGLTAVLCAVAGKWVKYVQQQQQQQQQKQSVGLHACFDLIGKCTSSHAVAMQPHSMPCTLCKHVMRPVPDLHRCL